MLQRCEDVYRRERKTLSYFTLSAEITELRHECPEWQLIPVGSARRVAKSLTLAFQAFFRRISAGEAQAGYPRYRRRVMSQAIPLGQQGWKLRQREDNPLSWTVGYKAVPGAIHARGRFPTAITDTTVGDIMWRDNTWWLSVCVEIPARRVTGGAVRGQGSLRDRTIVKFDLIDDLASVNGVAETPAEIVDAQVLQDDLDEMKSRHDISGSSDKREGESGQRGAAGGEITRLAARIARKRRNALHVWTARLVERYDDITIIAPPIKPHIKTPKGDEKNWGANVETVSKLNRNTLSLAPATAIQMLKYKAEEAGIRCDVVEDTQPALVVGRDLVVGGKQLRRARRVVKEAA
jgi:putative transposase